jgi:hypothetical protein
MTESDMPIPPFALSGILPPFLGDPTVMTAGSPYRVKVDEVVSRFATSPERVAILEGFLEYRKQASDFGLRGLQWLAGSFVEDIDAKRPPRDIDIVTLFERPPHLRDPVTFAAAVRARSDLFESPKAKLKYKCDAYMIDLSIPPMKIVDQVRYWYGLFSHRRTTLEWKGIVEVQLASAVDDSVAFQLLASKKGSM